MTSNNIKIISDSFREVDDFVEKIKIGNVYKILPSIKFVDDGSSIRFPSMIDINSDEWRGYLPVNEQNIVLCLEDKPWQVFGIYKTKLTSFIRWRWDCLYIKILYQEEIGLIHAAFLEPI